RPWSPEQQHQQQAYPDQPYRMSPHPDQSPGRTAAEEELRRAQARMQGAHPGQPSEPPPPIFVRKQRFVALAWAAFVLGIVGIVAGIAGALLGSSIVVLKYLTLGLAAVGVLLGVIALLGTRKVLAAIGTILCVGAIVVAMTAQVAAPASDNTSGGDAAAQGVTLRDCTVVKQGSAVKAEA